MYTFTILSRTPTTEKYKDNNGTYFSVSRVYVSSVEGAIERGNILLDNGTTTETVRIIEIDKDNNQLLTGLISGTWVVGDSCQFYAYDGASVGVDELVPGAAQVKIWPSSSDSQNEDRVRDDIKELKSLTNVLSASKSYYQSNILICRDSTPGQISIKGSSTNPIVFCRPSYLFYDESDFTLDVTGVGNDQFIDIYISDSGSTPLIAGTLRIALSGKTSGTSPYTSVAGAGEFCIGSVYIKNNLIIGCNSLRCKDSDQIAYINEAAFGLSITSITAYDYGVQEFYVPIFARSIFTWKVLIQSDTGVNAATDWSYELCIDINGTIVSRRTIKLDPMPTNTLEGRIPVLLEGNIGIDTPQLLTIKFGGKINDTFTYSDAIGVTTLNGEFKTKSDIHYQPIVKETPVTLNPVFSVIKSDFSRSTVYDIIPYNSKVYVADETTGGGNYTVKVHEYDPIGLSWSVSHTTTSSHSKRLYRGCVFNNKLYYGAYDLYGSAMKTRFDGSTWDYGVTPSNNTKRDICSFNNKVYHGFKYTTGRVYESPSGDDGTWTLKVTLPAGPVDVYSFKEFNGELYFGTDNGMVYKYAPNATVKYVLCVDFGFGATDHYVRGLDVIDGILVATCDNLVKISVNGSSWQSVVGPATVTRINRILTINLGGFSYLFACGGNSGAGGDPHLYYTDKTFGAWNEVVVDAACPNNYYAAMCWANNYLYVVTSNDTDAIANRVYKGTLS